MIQYKHKNAKNKNGYKTGLFLDINENTIYK